MNLKDFFDTASTAFGSILVLVLIALLLKDATKFNTLVTSAGTFVSDLGSLG